MATIKEVKREVRHREWAEEIAERYEDQGMVQHERHQQQHLLQKTSGSKDSAA